MDETADIPPDPREVSVRFSVDPRFEEPKDLNFERKREVLDRAGGRIADRWVSKEHSPRFPKDCRTRSGV